MSITNIYIGNSTNKISVSVANYSFKQLFIHYGDGFPFIVMKVYINNVCISSITLTMIGRRNLLMNNFMQFTRSEIMSLNFEEFCKCELDNYLQKEHNSDLITIKESNVDLLIYFNKSNFEEFKRILNFTYWFCMMAHVTESIL